MLSNPKNKANLANFLFRNWIKQSEERLEPEYELQLGGGFHDPNLAVIVTQCHTEEVAELTSDHEEVDSWMFLHIAYTAKTKEIKRVLLWSIDSSVAAMCPIYYLSLLIDKL